MDQFTICFWQIMSLKQDHVFGFGADSLGWLKIELVFGCKAFCPWWFRCFSGGWFMEPRQGVWNSRTEVFFARRWVVSNVQELTVSPIIFFFERLSSNKNHSRCAMFYFLSGKEVRSFREDVIKRCSMRHEQSPTMFQECTILNLFYVENWAYWLMLDIHVQHLMQIHTNSQNILPVLLSCI